MTLHGLGILTSSRTQAQSVASTRVGEVESCELSTARLRVIDAEEEITCDEMVDIIEKTLKWSGPS